jgi:hypothetical protein
MTEKDKATQNPMEAVKQADGSEEGKSAPLGKFANEQELAKAYKALEAEFTRRSQRLRELEKASEEGKPPQKSGGGESWEERVSALIQKYPVARELCGEIEEFIKENNTIIAQNDCLEYALINVLADSRREGQSKESEKEQLRGEIIAEYIASLKKETPKVMPKGGEIPAAPPIRCATIKEAGIIAEKILNS